VQATDPALPTIAVVDDEESVRAAVANLLQSLGLEVAAFGSAEEFLASPACATAACLISDIQMPGMSGLDLQRHLAAAGNRIPVILMTAFPKDTTRQQASADGAVGYLAKPFESGQLIDLIDGVLAAP
jgi:FixJ family two-component response regulator